MHPEQVNPAWSRVLRNHSHLFSASFLMCSVTIACREGKVLVFQGGKKRNLTQFSPTGRVTPGKAQVWGRKTLTSDFFLTADLYRNNDKHLNFLCLNCLRPLRLAYFFGKENACWKLAAPADGASPGRSVGLEEVLCVCQGCDWIFCCSVSLVEVSPGLQRHWWNFSRFCSLPNWAQVVLLSRGAVKISRLLFTWFMSMRCVWTLLPLFCLSNVIEIRWWPQEWKGSI